MITVAILALDNVLASSVMGTMDIFCQTGATWNYIVKKDEILYFDVKIVTKDGKPVKSKNQAAINPNCSINDIETIDIIIISSFSDYGTVETSTEAIEWLKKHNKKGATIASVCAGTYILAQTGLLDGKTATTHWGFANDFRKQYPNINLQPEKIITDEGNLLCSGGCNSYIDLSIYLVEKYCGKDIALESSKAMLHDIGRKSQEPYTAYQFVKDHNDFKIKSIQKWFEENYNQAFKIKDLAEKFGLSRRVFERRFKKATEDTPLNYLQRLRVEIAKKMIEESSRTFSEISFMVGYEDTSFFRKLFKKHTDLLPKEYRSKFCREE